MGNINKSMLEATRKNQEFMLETQRVQVIIIRSGLFIVIYFQWISECISSTVDNFDIMLFLVFDLTRNIQVQ